MIDHAVLRPGGPSALELEDLLVLLRKVGLSDYEAKAYIALVRRSHGSAEDVADVAGIPRTSAYKVLESLQKRNFVNSRGGRPAAFYPVPPLEIKDRIMAELERTFDTLDRMRGSLTEKGTPQLVYTIVSKEKVLAKIGDLLDQSKETFFLSSPELLEINAAFATRFVNAMKRGVTVTVVAEPSARVPDATEVFRKKDLLATDVVIDSEIALMASPDLSICGFTDNSFLAAHLENFFQMSLDRST